MNIYQIPATLDHQYRGAGYALAATCGGVLVRINMDEQFDYLVSQYDDVFLN